MGPCRADVGGHCGQKSSGKGLKVLSQLAASAPARDVVARTAGAAPGQTDRRDFPGTLSQSHRRLWRLAPWDVSRARGPPQAGPLPRAPTAWCSASSTEPGPRTGGRGSQAQVTSLPAWVPGPPVSESPPALGLRHLRPTPSRSHITWSFRTDSAQHKTGLCV